MKKNFDINLRPICFEDAEVLMALNNNSEVSNMVVGNANIVTMEQQLHWMSNLQNEKNIKRWMIDYENKVVGTVFLSSIDNLNCTCNANIKLLPEFHGKGIAKTALIKVCNIAFNELQLFCITANVLSFNISSQMLFKKVGFHEDGILRSRVIKNGERCDLVTFSLLKTDLLEDEISNERNR